ncbi:MAG: hypothetical protein HY094_02805 [Candidatus Melainabacteria bacterium]|nr:hypothetical protein [Candidatus Melainabacteria bacterium]
MAVQLTRSPVIPYQVIRRGLPWQTPRTNLKLVSSDSLDRSRAIASKIAFNASMEKAMLSQQYWDELLEKLRKGGGGGGGSKSFDRVTVSMMLTNFLSNKTIQAMLRNFTGDSLDIKNNNLNQLHLTNQGVYVNIIQKISNMVLNSVTGFISLIVRRYIPTMRLSVFSNQLSLLIGLLSFQLNKLKEVLEENLKEMIKKLDIKEKIRKVKAALTDFFVELKENLLSAVDEFKFFLKFLFKNNFHVTNGYKAEKM